MNTQIELKKWGKNVAGGYSRKEDVVITLVENGVRVTYEGDNRQRETLTYINGMGIVFEAHASGGNCPIEGAYILREQLPGMIKEFKESKPQGSEKLFPTLDALAAALSRS